MSFFWYVMNTIFLEFQSAGNTMITALGTNSTTTTQVNTFFTNAASYSLVLFVIGLTIWALQYSQKRGTVVYD